MRSVATLPRRSFPRSSHRPAPAVLGWGTALPPHRYRQADLARRLAEGLTQRQARRLAAAFRASGVRTRHSVLPDFDAGCAVPRLFNGGDPTTSERLAVFRDEAPLLAELAARRALACAGVGAGQVTHLLFVTCTGLVSPGPDRDLVERLGLSPSVRRVQIGFQGCSAGLVALRTAAEITSGREDAVVLVLACELSSLHFRQCAEDRELRGHALFADGAGAALVAAGAVPEGGAGVAVHTRLGRGESLLVPGTESDMTWEVGERGFAMRLTARVPERLAAALPAFVRRSGRPSRIRHWAVHPGGPAILDRVGTALGVAADRLATAREVLRDCGNMSSATIFFVLERAARAGPGDGLALAFGPGLTAESLSFRVDEA